MKTFAIGDIHGNYPALQQCLERSGFDKKKHRLISLGDVADGWHQTPECVEELLTIENLIRIRGNHDVWTMNWLNSADAPGLWINQGGRATRDAYIEQNKVNDQQHIDFFNHQTNYYIDEENRLFVHAGFNLTYGFKWSKTASVGIPFATELHWNRDCAEFNTKSWGKTAIKHLDEFKEIFIGHTSHNTTKFNYPEKHNIWNIDTGAGWNGKLTIMDVETKEYWQSDPASLLYPGRKSR